MLTPSSSFASLATVRNGSGSPERSMSPSFILREPPTGALIIPLPSKLRLECIVNTTLFSGSRINDETTPSGFGKTLECKSYGSSLRRSLKVVVVVLDVLHRGRSRPLFNAAK